MYINKIIKGLEQLHEDLSILEVLVYEVGLDNMFLEDIEQMNTLEKASLFMSRVCKTNLTFIFLLLKFILFLCNLIVRRPHVLEQFDKLLFAIYSN